MFLVNVVSTLYLKVKTWHIILFDKRSISLLCINRLTYRFIHRQHILNYQQNGGYLYSSRYTLSFPLSPHPPFPTLNKSQPECEDGKFGVGCKEDCSDHCAGDGDTCDHVTGVCTNRCDPGYTGDNCTQGRNYPNVA